MEITHMDWPRAVLHMGVSEVDSASLGEMATQQREQKVSARERHGLTVSRTVEEYTCGITQRGITTHGHLAQHKG